MSRASHAHACADLPTHVLPVYKVIRTVPDDQSACVILNGSFVPLHSPMRVFEPVRDDEGIEEDGQDDSHDGLVDAPGWALCLADLRGVGDAKPLHADDHAARRQRVLNALPIGFAILVVRKIDAAAFAAKLRRVRETLLASCSKHGGMPGGLFVIPYFTRGSRPGIVRMHMYDGRTLHVGRHSSILGISSALCAKSVPKFVAHLEKHLRELQTWLLDHLAWSCDRHGWRGISVTCLRDATVVLDVDRSREIKVRRAPAAARAATASVASQGREGEQEQEEEEADNTREVVTGAAERAMSRLNEDVQALIEAGDLDALISMRDDLSLVHARVAHEAAVLEAIRRQRR